MKSLILETQEPSYESHRSQGPPIPRSVSQFIIPIDQRTYSWTQKEYQQLWHDILRAGASDEIGVLIIGSMLRINPQAPRTSSTSTPACLRIDAQCCLWHVPSMIGDGGVTITGFAIPDFMRACRLSIKDKAEATQLSGDFAIAKT